MSWLKRAAEMMGWTPPISLDEGLKLHALNDLVEAAAYIEAVQELDDPTTLPVALPQVAKAHGIAEVAGRADMCDKTLFRALSENGNPRLSTVHKVLRRDGVSH